MKLLYLTTVMPNNVKSGGEIVSRQCIEALRDNHDVIVLAYKRVGESVVLNSDDHVVNERVIETGSSKVWPLFWLLMSFIKNRSYSSQKFCSRKYIKSVTDLLNNNSFDVIVVDHSQLSWVLNYLSDTVPIVFISHNIEYLVYLELANQSANMFKKNIYKRESKLMKQEEIRLLKRSEQVWALSKSDKQGYSRLLPNEGLINVINVPGGFKELIQCEDKHDIGILGTWSWESNKKGLEWFLLDVLPLINSRYRVSLGGKGSLSYKNQYPDVQALGMVDDAQTFLSSCRIIVIPTVAGGGIQIKTLDSISTNKPIVTTSIGVRGITPVPDSVFVIDNAEDFANKINELLASKEKFSHGFSWTDKRRNNFAKNLNSYVSVMKYEH